jgi:predicted amidohydrolase YtcJ
LNDHQKLMRSQHDWCCPLLGHGVRRTRSSGAREQAKETQSHDQAAAASEHSTKNSYAYYNSDEFHFYGEELMRHCMAYRSFLDAGIHVAAGSDFDPGPFSPLMAIQGMVTRKGWNNEIWGANQRVTITEALQINTLNGAYNSHEETIKGSISAGKLADFVVLAEDLHTVDPDKIKDIKIYRTVTGGATVYQV